MALKLEYKVLSVETHGRVLHGIVSGKLEKEDYDLLVPEAERLIEKSGKIRVLVELIDFKGWSAGALWEECKFAYHHLKDVERMAMVGGTLSIASSADCGTTITARAPLRNEYPDHA